VTAAAVFPPGQDMKHRNGDVGDGRRPSRSLDAAVLAAAVTTKAIGGIGEKCVDDGAVNKLLSGGGHSGSVATVTAMTAETSHFDAKRFLREAAEAVTTTAAVAPQSQPSSRPRSRRRRGRTRGQVNGDDDSVQFSYSVSYFNWAVSSEEEDSSDEENECVDVTLPLRRLTLSKGK